MATSKDDVLAIVNKLIADVETQGESKTAENASHAAVVVALQQESAAVADHSSKTATVQADLAELKTAAANLADEDDAT